MKNDVEEVIANVREHLVSRLDAIGFGEVSVKIVIHDGTVRRVDFGEQQKVQVTETCRRSGARAGQ